MDKVIYNHGENILDIRKTYFFKGKEDYLLTHCLAKPLLTFIRYFFKHVLCSRV